MPHRSIQMDDLAMPEPVDHDTAASDDSSTTLLDRTVIAASSPEPEHTPERWTTWDVHQRKQLELTFIMQTNFPLNGSWDRTESYIKHKDEEMLKYLLDFPTRQWAVGEDLAYVAYKALLDRYRLRDKGLSVFNEGLPKWWPIAPRDEKPKKDLRRLKHKTKLPSRPAVQSRSMPSKTLNGTQPHPFHLPSMPPAPGHIVIPQINPAHDRGILYSPTLALLRQTPAVFKSSFKPVNGIRRPSAVQRQRPSLPLEPPPITKQAGHTGHSANTTRASRLSVPGPDPSHPEMDVIDVKARLSVTSRSVKRKSMINHVS